MRARKDAALDRQVRAGRPRKREPKRSPCIDRQEVVAIGVRLCRSVLAVSDDRYLPADDGLAVAREQAAGEHGHAIVEERRWRGEGLEASRPRVDPPRVIREVNWTRARESDGRGYGDRAGRGLEPEDHVAGHGLDLEQVRSARSQAGERVLQRAVPKARIGRRPCLTGLPDQLRVRRTVDEQVVANRGDLDTVLVQPIFGLPRVIATGCIGPGRKLPPDGHRVCGAAYDRDVGILLPLARIVRGKRVPPTRGHRTALRAITLTAVGVAAAGNCDDGDTEAEQHVAQRRHDFEVPHVSSCLRNEEPGKKQTIDPATHSAAEPARKQPKPSTGDLAHGGRPHSFGVRRPHPRPRRRLTNG